MKKSWKTYAQRYDWGVLICLVVNMTLHTSFWKIQIPKMPFNVESLNFQSQCYGGVIVWFSQFSVHDLSVFTYVQELLCGLPLCLSKRVYKLYSPLKVHQQLSPNRFSSASPLQLSFCKFSHKPTFRLHPFGLQNAQKFKVSILCSFLVHTAALIQLPIKLGPKKVTSNDMFWVIIKPPNFRLHFRLPVLWQSKTCHWMVHTNLYQDS